MPWQEHLIVGYRISDKQTLLDLAKRLGVEIKNVENARSFEDNFYGAECVVIEGENYRTELYFEHEGISDVFSKEDTNTITGEVAGVGYYGVMLTNRYSPAILDVGWEYGKPSQFVLDLPRLQAILDEVRKVLPDAQIFTQDIFF